MADHDLDPLDRLRGLADGPLPPLAAADDVRARGDQRRRRARTAVGVTAAAVVLAGGAAFGLGSAGGPDSLAPAPPFASPTAEPTPTPSVEPTASPTAGPTAGPARPVPPEALLTAAEAARVAGGSWTEGDDQEHSFPLRLVCGDEPGGAAGLYRSVEGPGTQSVLAQVVRYPDSAGDVVARVVSDVARCPSRDEDAAPPATATVRNELVRSDDDSAVVRQTTRECDPACTERTSLVLVVQVGDLVGYLGLGAQESTRTAAWAGVVRDRLGACAQGACPRTGPRTALTAADPLTATGIGPVAVGARLQAAVRAAGQPFTDFVDDLGNGCGFVAPRSQSPDISLMVVRDVVVRIDVDGGSTTRTASGLGLGATLAEVRAAHPGATSEKQPYTFHEVLTVRQGDFGLLFESDGRVVTAIRAGTLDALRSFEGCA